MRSGARAAVVAVACLAVLWFLPLLVDAAGLPNFYLVFAYFLLFWATQATSWAITSGYAGYFSFGQGAFIGVGVYTTAVLTTREGWGFVTAILVGGVLAGALALLTGSIAFRLKALRGEVFALLTLFVAFVVASVARAFRYVDGGQGVTVTVPEFPELLGSFSEAVFRLALLLAVATLVTAWAIQRSRLGWALFTVRDAEDVAEGLGVKTLRVKLTAFTITGFISGLSGGLHTVQLGYVSINEVFGLTVPLLVILMAIFGGKGTWYGPAIGAAFIFGLRDRMTGSAFEEYSQIVLGVILVLVVLFVPEGLGPRLRAHRVPAAVGAATGFAVAAVASVGGLLDWIVIGMVTSAVAVFLAPRLPAGRRRSTPADAPPSQPKEAARS